MPNDDTALPKSDVAVVIDYDNLFYSIRSNCNSYPNLEEVLDAAGRYGRVACSQAFGDWGFFAKSLPSLFRAGVQPVFCPLSRTNPMYHSHAKSSVDATICVQTMKTFFGNPHIQTLVLVSGDRDYIPLVIELRQMGKQVAILGVGKSLSSDLAEVADETILYEDIVKDLIPRGDTQPVKRVELSADPYPILIEEVKAARENRKPTVLAYLKLRLKERIAGFDETQILDNNGRPFKKFKDFITEAATRGLIKVYTTGTANEVFLPEEDPKDLSYFKDIVNNTEDSPEFPVPPVDVVEMMASILEDNDGPMAYTKIVQGLQARKQKGEMLLSKGEIQRYVKSSIHHGILRGEKDGNVTRYNKIESWRDMLSQVKDE